MAVLGVCLLAACAGGGTGRVTATAAPLPPPQVYVENIPSPTLVPPTEAVMPEPAATATETPQILAWPTLDEEEYLVTLIEKLLDEIDRRLRSTDTQLNP